MSANEQEYHSPSTGRVIRAVLFDTFGTVVDWRSGIARTIADFARDNDITIDAEEFADAWRAQYQPAMQRVRSGARQYVTLDTLHRENLELVLRDLRLDVDAVAQADLDRLALAWRWLPPWPDSVDGIGAMKRRFIVGPLSNANTALLVDMAKFGALPWDVVLGSDVSRTYKPDPAAYHAQAGFLGLDVGEVMLVAAHNADLRAAQQAGLATAFVARPDEHGAGRGETVPDGTWDASGASLTELARQFGVRS
jgi:2-haloacid dehalogenase